MPVGTIKRFIAGKGNADKAAVIAAVRERGFSPADDNEADALAILLWAIETAGRRAMTRTRLPDRRAAETVALEHNGTRFMVTIGFYPDGRPGEVFTHGIRTGSSLDALLADACVVVSCLIQHGVEPRDLAASMGRLGNAEPASIIGAVVDLVAAASIAQQQICRGGQHMTSEQILATGRRHHRRAGRGLRRRRRRRCRRSPNAGRSRSATPSRRRRSCCA